MRILNKLYVARGEKKNPTSWNPYAKPHRMWWYTGAATFASSSIGDPRLQAQPVHWLWPPPHLAGLCAFLEPAKWWCSKSEDSSSSAVDKKGAHSFLATWHLNFEALRLAVSVSWAKYCSTGEGNRASVTESAITVELLMTHEYNHNKMCTFMGFARNRIFYAVHQLVLLGDFSTLTPNS